MNWAFTLKENQPELRREAERFTTGPPAGVESEPERELRGWHVPQIDWPVADRLVRVVKTVRIDGKREVMVRPEGDRLGKSKSEVTHEFGTGRDPGVVHPSTRPQPMARRHRGLPDHYHRLPPQTSAVHQSTALVVLTMIRLLAYTLTLVFYQRQIGSHARGRCDTFHQFAKRLA